MKLKERKKKNQKKERDISRDIDMFDLFLWPQFLTFSLVVFRFQFARLLHFLIVPSDKSIVDHIQTVVSVQFFFCCNHTISNNKTYVVLTRLGLQIVIFVTGPCEYL